MSEKLRFRQPIEKQLDKRAKTLFQFQRKHPYHSYWSLWRYLSWKKSLLVTCKILKLFVNTLTTYDKFSLLNRDNLIQPISMLLSQKEKRFSEHTSIFFKLTLNFHHFQKKKKKKWPPSLIYFRYYGLWNRWLDECPKIPISEDVSRGNMVNGLKHCFNLKDSTFTIFIDHCEGNWVGKRII